MIKVDISNVWGGIALPDLLAMEKEVAAAHATLMDGTGEGNDFLGWQNLPVRELTEEISRILSAARKIRNDSDVFVVIGIGGSYLGPRAAIELLQGPNHNIGKGKGNPQIYFAGNGLSTRHWNELCRLLEGKDVTVNFNETAELTADLHSLGQMIQQGERNIFETMVRFDAPEQKMVIGGDVKNLDGLNYLEGKTLDFVDEKAFLGTLAAHVDGGVPVITMDCGELNDRKVGEMFYFLELCCGVSAYLLGVNPFNQPGVELYKRNMFKLLGKPGYENK